MVEEYLKKLIILRLQAWPPDMKVASGSGEPLSRDQIIEHVQHEDKIGKEIIEMQLKYLRSMKAGVVHA